MDPRSILVIVCCVIALSGSAQIKRSGRDQFFAGLSLQYHSALIKMVDVNPYVAFRLHHAITVGTGWNHRFVDRRVEGPEEWFRMYGPRSFVQVSLPSRFSIHAEVEYLRSFLPAFTERHRNDWIQTTMLGVRKQVTLVEHLNGFAAIIYRVDGKGNYPYDDFTNLRLGVEYALR